MFTTYVGCVTRGSCVVIEGESYGESHGKSYASSCQQLYVQHANTEHLSNTYTYLISNYDRGVLGNRQKMSVIKQTNKCNPTCLYL